MIDEVKYIRADSVPQVDPERAPLAILMNNDRGLCIVGHADMSGDGPDDMIPVPDARCIIRWGTTRHLAELAKKGPMSNTKLGDRWPQEMSRRSICYRAVCDPEAWDV
jgi:hypothetical protein